MYYMSPAPGAPGEEGDGDVRGQVLPAWHQIAWGRGPGGHITHKTWHSEHQHEASLQPAQYSLVFCDELVADSTSK